MKWLCCLGQFIGRVLLSLIFISAGAGKLLNFNESLQYMNAHGIVTLAPVLLVGALILELIGGVLLIVGYKTKLVAFLLFLFLIPTTIIFHNFWDIPEPNKTVQSIMFFKNLAIMGGLLILASKAPDMASMDCYHKCDANSEK